MKKLLVLLAVLFVVCLLPACTGAEETPSAPAAGSPSAASSTPGDAGDGSKTETVSIGDLTDVEVVTAAGGMVTYNGLTMARLESSLPREYVAEKLAAGKEVLAAYCLAEVPRDDVTRRVNGLLSSLEALGFTVGTAEAGQNAVVEIEQIENYVTMGAAYIQCEVGSIATYEDVAAYAMSNGTYIGFWGQTPQFEAAGVYAFDQKELGSRSAQMASEWVDLIYPDAGEGEVHAALLGNEHNDDTTLRTRSIREGIEKNPKVQITFYSIDHLGTDGAYTGAEQAMTTDPDIRVLMTFATGQAIGVNNYIISQPYDLTKFGVFSCTEDEALITMIEEAVAGGSSVCRGTIGYAAENLWDAEYKLITELLFLGAEPMHIVYDELREVRSF